MQRWFVVESLPNSERKAAFNLKDQGFPVFLPVFHKITRHARRVITVEAPYFPRYLFVQFDAQVARWTAIKSTRGVLRLLTDVNDVPMPISTAFVEELHRRAAKTGGVIKLTDDETKRFRKGDQVRVNEGPFTSFLALVDHMAGDRVHADVELFGRQTRVNFDEVQLSAA